MLLLAQQIESTTNASPTTEEAVWVIVPMAFLGLLLMIVVQIAYLRTLSLCLRRVSPWNRAMEPAAVWLNLLPGFDIFWRFITVRGIYKSLRREFKERRLVRVKQDYGKRLGYAYCVLVFLWGGVSVARLVEPIVNPGTPIPNFYLMPIFLVAWVGFWIAYWAEVASYSRRLLETDASRQYGLEH